MADLSITYPYKFVGGEKAVATEVNANFDAIKVFASTISSTISEIQSAITDLKDKPTREMFDIYYSITSQTPTGAFPLWTGETINNCKLLYPQFWEKLNNYAKNGKVPTVASNEAYNAKVNQYGQCASFYIDTLNGHVRLPKITRFISSIDSLNQLATEQEAGLPNITGYLRPYMMGDVQGAFYQSESDYSHTSSKDGSHNHGQSSVRLDASRSNSVYGKSNTVQPPAVRLCLYLQVVNNTAELSRFDVDAVTEQMTKAIAELEKQYNDYSASLKSIYDDLMSRAFDASPIIKIDDTTVSPSLFVSDTKYADYPYKADIPIDEADDVQSANVIFDVAEADSGNFAPVCEIGDNYVRIWAKAVPEAEFVIPTIILE